MRIFCPAMVASSYLLMIDPCAAADAVSGPRGRACRAFGPDFTQGIWVWLPRGHDCPPSSCLLELPDPSGGAAPVPASASPYRARTYQRPLCGRNPTIMPYLLLLVKSTL